MSKVFRYGMKYRGFSPMCQPIQNLLGIEEHDSVKVNVNGEEYYDILRYSEKLSESDVRAYELDFLGEE